MSDSNPEIEIRMLRPGEEDALNLLYNSINKPFRNKEFFDWEFKNCPCGEALYVVAFDKVKDKIVGTQAAIPIEYENAKGEKILTAKSEDTLLNSEYRGKGLFDKMYKLLFEECNKAGIKYIWGFTYAHKPFKKVGFEIPFTMKQGVMCMHIIKSYNYFSVLNPKNHMIKKIKIMGMVLFSFLKHLKTVFTKSSVYPYVIKKQRIADKQKLLNSISSNGSLWSIKQDNKYLDWRLLKNPYQNNYIEFTLLDKKDGPIGNILFNIRPEKFAYIEQLLINNEVHEKIKRAFVIHSISELEKENVFAIRYWGSEHSAPNKSEMELLKKAGLVFVNTGAGFVWKKSSFHTIDPVSITELYVSRLFTQGNY